MAKNNQHVTEQYITGKGELVGYISVITPSTKFNPEGKYSANILLDKKEGKALADKIKEVRTQQFKTYGKGTKVTDITQCIPYTTVDEETGEEIPDKEGRYILKAAEKAYIENGKINKKLRVINAKKQDVKNVKVGEGTIARLGVILSGYTVAGKTGVSVKLGMVQIIKLVEYSSSGFSLDGFDEEDGYDGVGEEFTEELTSTPAGEEEEDEEDFGF